MHINYKYLFIHIQTPSILYPVDQNQKHIHPSIYLILNLFNWTLWFHITEWDNDNLLLKVKHS